MRTTLHLMLLLCGEQMQQGRLPDVIYMDQPTGIELAVYEATWPTLKPIEARLHSGVIEADFDGAWNLLAQLQWQRGDLADADLSAARAVSLGPKQALNHLQQAMVNFAHLRKASGWMEQWKWQRRTFEAYERTFALDPHNWAARYYLAYSYMNTPAIGGGDKKKALDLSQGGIDLGQVGFYAVRADAHRLRGEMDAANRDYDTAIGKKVIKLGGFLDAAADELERKHWDRAKRYLDWAVHCRPDASKAHEGLGDYFAAVNDGKQAAAAYERSLARDPKNESAREKLHRSFGR